LDCFETEHKFVAELPFSFNRVRHIVDEKTFETLCVSLKRREFDLRVEEAMESGAEIITYFSDKYPRGLRDIPNPPSVLYCIGNTDLLERQSIAVVGSRKNSLYGEKVARQFVKDLVRHGVTIVSGMALGIDGIAHRAALDGGGKTVAVLGGGFDKIYPPQHESLFREICGKGLVVTEFAPATPAQPYHFPLRNRIVSGLSDGVLMVEAGQKSGTFTTINHALEQGKDIFIPPAEIYSPFALGSNEMLKTMQGALVTSAKDIVEGMHGVWQATQKEAVRQLDINEKLIADCLSDGAKDFDVIMDGTKISVSELQSCLSKMEIEGIVEKQSGNRYKLILEDFT
jgi:DNA processing protein